VVAHTTSVAVHYLSAIVAINSML